MINCNFKIVNALYNKPLYKINYLPFSISTIKILIDNNEDAAVDILIKPINSQNNDDFCGGFDDDNNGLKIIWGGGQENGIHTVIKGHEKKYVFLFVFPTFNLKLIDYNLTLVIKKTLLNSERQTLNEQISIKLQPIQTVELVENIVHQNTINNNDNVKITFDGNLIGTYYPRWYPELYKLFNNKDFYKPESSISNISFKILKQSQGFNKDRIVLNFHEKEIAIIEGDMHGASYHIDIFRFNTSLIVRIWLLWISKKQFLDKDNLEPLRMLEERRGFFDNPELPDFERFDIIISPDGNILAVCTDFHWQEYWYRLRKKDTTMIGIVAKVFPPIEDSLNLLLNRNYVTNNYEDVIQNLINIISSSENDFAKMVYAEGEKIEEALQTKETSQIQKGKNFFRSHVPYVRNGNVLSNMISKIVEQHE